MKFVLQPWHLPLLILAGWINRHRQDGIDPASDRKRQATWKTFVQAHWDVLAAIDFTTIEVWTKSGLVTFYLLFVTEGETTEA